MAGKEDAAADYYIQSPATKLKTDPGASRRPALGPLSLSFSLCICVHGTRQRRLTP